MRFGDKMTEMKETVPTPMSGRFRVNASEGAREPVNARGSSITKPKKLKASDNSKIPDSTRLTCHHTLFF